MRRRSGVRDLALAAISASKFTPSWLRLMAVVAPLFSPDYAEVCRSSKHVGFPDVHAVTRRPLREKGRAVLAWPKVIMDARGNRR